MALAPSFLGACRYLCVGHRSHVCIKAAMHVLKHVLACSNTISQLAASIGWFQIVVHIMHDCVARAFHLAAAANGHVRLCNPVTVAQTRRMLPLGATCRSLAVLVAVDFGLGRWRKHMLHKA
jgi:hypothetical protein